MRVWKFEFPQYSLNSNANSQHWFEINMPKGAEIIYTDWQGSRACFWALVDPDEEKEQREFYVVGTGHGDAFKGDRHIATLQEGSFVWHIFEPQE